MHPIARRRVTRILQTFLLGIVLIQGVLFAEAIRQTKGDFVDKFRQLEESYPTPNDYRNAAGEPGYRYWQQRVDYDIRVSLNESERRISGSELITYHNNSPDTLKYLWLQLDQNVHAKDSMANRTQTFSGGKDGAEWRGPARDEPPNPKD